MTGPAVEPAVRVRGLTHRYGDRVALDGIDLDVARGDLFALLGPNGGGKTTLFRILSTLMPATAGTAELLGHAVAADPAGARGVIGVLFQSPSLDVQLTVAENLRHQGHLYGLRGAALGARIERMLARVRLGDRAGERAGRLSGGLRRRAELAKAMLHGPRLLLLDEPSSGLDPGARRDLREQLVRLRDEEGVTVLLTTHLMEEAEAADRIAILDRGRIVAGGRPQDLRRELGGDVIELAGPEPEALSRGIRERFGAEAALVDGTLRLERADGRELLAELLPAFAGRIDSASLHRPTLEDVFISRTGHRFEAGGAGP